MKEIIDATSALHNFKQAHGLCRDRATNAGTAIWAERRRLQSLLEGSINRENHRAVAAETGMNALDLRETVTTKLDTLGIVGLQAAIQVHEDHGIVACLQYLDSLLTPRYENEENTCPCSNPPF